MEDNLRSCLTEITLHIAAKTTQTPITAYLADMKYVLFFVFLLSCVYECICVCDLAFVTGAAQTGLGQI